MKCPHCQADNETGAISCVKCGRRLASPRSSPLDDLSPGTVFDSRYKIVSTLGRGGMGTVYKARDLVLDEIVAIKVLRPDYALDPKMAERFKSEIKLARKVRHKNVCSIHDFGEYEGFLYISMEFIEGVDLKRVLKEKGAPPIDTSYELAIQVAQGLQAVHDAGIIHRDLKSSNIMSDKDGVVRLMDFGVAKQYGAGGTITSTGQVVGTPEYMSPEQAQGHKLDFRSDVYAIGVLIYELFTGHVPFRGDTPISTILKHIHEPPPIYGPSSSKIPAPLIPILRKALAKNPNERQSSVNKLIDELKRARRERHHPQSMPTALEEGTTLLAPTPASVRAARPAKSRGLHLPWPWFLAVAAVAVAVGAVWMYQILTPNRELGEVETVDSSVASGTTAPGDPGETGEDVPGGEGAASPAREAEAAPTTSVAPSTVPPTTRPTTSIQAPRSTTSTAPITTTTSVSSTSVSTTSSVVPTTTLIVGKGWLQVGVIPWGEVRVDGELMGTTPIDRINLDSGAHTVRIRHPDYEIYEKNVTIRPDETEKLVVNLPRDGIKKK